MYPNQKPNKNQKEVEVDQVVECLPPCKNVLSSIISSTERKPQ
jgi:hypothetical protein